MSDDILDPPAALGARPVDFEAPWLGLLPFTVETRRFFFGRDMEIRELFLRVRSYPLTILYSQSGLGKTSLLGAGLVPKLRADGYRPILLRLRYEKDDAPPVAQIRAALAAASSDETIGANDLLARWKNATLWEAFHDPALRMERLASAPPVLIFDQFEDVFTRGKAQRSPEEIHELAIQLSDLVENRLPGMVQSRLAGDYENVVKFDFAPSPLRLIISLREDFLSHLETWKAALPSLMRNRMPLQLLTGPQALEAVVQPGRLRGTGRAPIISTETGNAIVHFVAGVNEDVPLEEIDAVPPLLSLLCYELNERRMAEKRDEIVPTDLSGRAEDILNDYYVRSLRGRPRELRLLIEEQLLSPGGHRQPVNYDTAVRALTKGCGSAELAEQLLGEVIRERLLTVVESGDLRRLELTHDILCPIARRSRDARHEEEEKERLLQEAEAARIREHEAEERAKVQRRQLKRTRRLVAFVTVLALACLGVIAYGILKARESAKNYQLAQEERAKADTLREAAEKDRNRALELLRDQSRSDLSLALERAEKGDEENLETIVPLLAHSLQAWPENEDANLYLWLLLRHGFPSFSHVPAWTLYLPRTTDDDDVVWSSDGKLLAATVADGRIAIFNVPPSEQALFLGKAVEPASAPSETESSVQSSRHIMGLWSDPKAMLVAQDDGGWTIYDLSGKTAHKEISGPAVLISLSPDGLRAIALVTDTTAAVVEASSGRLLGKPFPILTNGEERVFVWKSDGQTVFHLDEKGKVQRRDGRTGVTLGAAFAVPPVSSFTLSPSGNFALVIKKEEKNPQHTRAEVWRLQNPPDCIKVIERPQLIGWHPLTGRLLFNIDGPTSQQFDPLVGTLKPYAGFSGMREPPLEADHRDTFFDAKGRRSLLEMPLGISASRTYDFADEDWADEERDPGESGVYYLLSADGFFVAQCHPSDVEGSQEVVQLYSLRGPQTNGWRNNIVSNIGSPVTSPDGQYEIGNDIYQQPMIRRKKAGEEPKAIPLPFPELARVEWSSDGKTLILIASSGREQHWPWPPPQSWEPALHPWISQFAPVSDEPVPASSPKSAPPAKAPGTAEPSPWLESLREAKLKDRAWAELQQWWLNGRDRSAEAPKPAP